MIGRKPKNRYKSRGMDKPKNCHECPFLYVTAVCDGSKSCPILDIKPHGRLIDADALNDKFVEEGQRSKRYKLGEIWELNGKEIRTVIGRLPTIIEAERGKNDEP